MVCTTLTGVTETPACAWPTVNWIPPYSACFDEAVCGAGFQCGLSGYDYACFIDDPRCPGIDCGDVCAPVCLSDEDCPPSPGGTAPATCVDNNGDAVVEVCALDCSSGTCPDGMTCREWINGAASGSACMWL